MYHLTEGELEFVFEDAVSARKFDGHDHGLSHCMKAVDFIIEFQDKYLFIEVKDPQNSDATEDCRRQWIKKLTSKQLDQDLKYKYRDSFLYEWCAGRGDKPITYVVLIALDSLDSALMGARQDELRRILPTGTPLSHGSAPWLRGVSSSTSNTGTEHCQAARSDVERRRSDELSP
ncbi:MAG TPA: hypothetical protein DD643_04610 [Synechococcus sp. UBA8638]|nr:hypothetical protein [Synechococcus sp. UBA8638]